MSRWKIADPGRRLPSLSAALDSVVLIASAFPLAATLGVGALAPVTRADAQQPAAMPAPAGERGSIAGRVFDKESGQPLPYATVDVVALRLGGQTDLDGRYRIAGIPLGVHQVRARHIGHQAQIIDSVRVQGREATVVSFSLSTAAQQLSAVAIVAAPVTTGNSEVALLAMRKAAAAVMDGVSAEAMSRAPGSDAADAIVRVTGVSVVDDKFVVVRGLPERYSNTLLNGVELPSPEPLKKVVPLDIFPASLLESIVTTKTATPDRPADFAGGSVEIRTKEFPDNRVAQVSFTAGYNSLSTFAALPAIPWRGLDYLGFDAGGRRARPGGNPVSESGAGAERWGEGVRNVWTPEPRRVLPELGFTASLGGQHDPEGRPLGYIFSLNYGTKTDWVPERLYRFVTNDVTGAADRGFLASEVQQSVDWGGIANFAMRVGPANKLGWKNLYTRNAEEAVANRIGFETYNGDNTSRTYQVRYVTRDFMQTQITGDHHLARLHQSRMEWKATRSHSERDEPDNRSAIYGTGNEERIAGPPTLWFRYLTDRQWSGNLDWQTPFELPFGSTATVRAGGSYRDKRREFVGEFYRFLVLSSTDPALLLPPERALAPENIGSTFGVESPGSYALPYRSTDLVGAGYAMLDLRATERLRLVGGVRVERWTLVMQQGTEALPVGDPIDRATTDRLWSGNATISFGERMNLRLAAYQTLARPDPRELSEENFTAVTGECSTSGNPLLRPSRIENADVRWEMYPSPTTLFSIGTFYKKFSAPIIETVTLPGSSRCSVFPTNADDATNYGLEVETRAPLGFLPFLSDRFEASFNSTYVQTSTNWRPGDGTELLELPMQGQSDYIVNLSLQYTDTAGGLSGSVVANAFGDRIIRYGTAVGVTDGSFVQIPHVYERGRVTLDAKVTRRVGRRTTVSISGRNLTNAAVEFYQDSEAGRVPTGYQASGISVAMGIGRAF